MVTASVVRWTELLATDPELRVRVPELTDVLDRIRYFFFQVAPQLYSRG
jgi:hypothetical protein